MWAIRGWKAGGLGGNLVNKLEEELIKCLDVSWDNKEQEARGMSGGCKVKLKRSKMIWRMNVQWPSTQSKIRLAEGEVV